MGGSRRRLKKTAPKVKVGLIKRKKNEKARLPLDVVEHKPGFEERLRKQVNWTEQQTLTRNYGKNKLVLDPNEGFGRNKSNKSEAPLKSKEERLEEDGETYSDDDELRVVCNKERKTGVAPPPRLTTHQRQIMERLIEKYGEDVEGMFRDRKLNKMQHSKGKLQELLEAHQYWKPGDKHDFRGPNKPYKRL